MLGVVPAAVEAEAAGTIPKTEPEDDYAANTSTTGTVVVGGSLTGEIESHGDVDWIRVILVGGTRYVIDYDGSANGQGTLSDPYFRGVYDSNGNLISGTTDDNGGLGLNSRIDFTPSSSGTYFLGLGNSAPSLTGTYRVSVTEFDDYVVEVIIPGDDYEDDVTTTGSVAVGGSAVGHFQEARGPSDSDWIRTTTESFWTSFDHDWFRVTFDAGKTYRVHIKGSWTDHGTLRDTRIAGIYNSNGNLIAGTVDDNSGIDKEARTIFTAPTSGTHYISATRGEFPFPAQASGTYTVKVEQIGDDDYAANTSTTGSVTVDGSTTGTIERMGDLDWFAVTLEGYATYRFDLEGNGEDWPLLEGKFIRGIYDSNGNVFAGTYTPESRDDEVRAVFAPEQGGTYYVAVGAGETFFGTGEYRLSATKFIPEVSDWLDTQGRVGVGSYVAGAIEAAHDRDWFRVTLEAGTTYQVDLEGSPTNQGTLRDPYLHGIRDSEGALIWYTTDDNSGVGMNSRVSFTPDSDGTYYIEAGALFGRTGTYRLSVMESGEPTLSVSDASANEADGSISFAVSLSAAASAAVTVDYATQDGTATAGSDYTATSGTLTFSPGETSKTLNVTLIDDTVEDNGETFKLILSNASGASLGDAEATGTILNMETPLTASVSDASAAEGDAVEFTVSLSAASAQQVTVEYATSDGTAAAGEDYTAESGTVTFAANETSKTVSVATTDDSVDEEDETFTLTLSSPTNATLGDATATGTINDDDNAPALTGFTLVNAGTDTDIGPIANGASFTFADPANGSYGIRAEPASDAEIGSVRLALSGAATASRTENWAPYSLYGDDGVNVAGEGLPAGSYSLTAKAYSEGDLGGQEIGSLAVSFTVVAAELPALAVSDASATEGDAVTFTVSLSAAAGEQVTVEYATSGGTATSGTDFTAESGTLTFAANETSKTVSVATTDDSVDEGDETFTLTLSSPANATLSAATATGTINDDDEPPTVSVSDASATEGDAVEFTVSLSAASGQQVTAQYATSNGTAESGTDFTAESGTVTFTAGETSQTVNVATTDDSVDEGDETFTLTLSSPANGTLGDATATGTINDNDETLPTVSVSDASAAEGDAVAFTVTLSAVSSQQVTVDYATSGGTATSGTDFTAESGTLTFAASETSKTVSVATTDDSVDEDNETFTLTLSNPANATLGDATATGTINDNDVSTTPLTASFSNMPASHTGAEFTFGLAFSESVELSYVTLRDTAFVVTGGEVKTAQRQQQGSNQAWNITVEPASANDAVTITLPETTDCDAVDAICTGDGRPLSHSLSATVAGPVIIPTVSVSDASAAEGDAVAFTVSLSAASSQQVTVEYATSGGTATSGTDFTAESGTLTFTANETTKTVSVATTDDSVDEDDETFTLTLSSPANATLGDATATGTINDNDESLPTVSVSDASAAEGDAVAFTVSLSGASSQQVTVAFATSGGTATSGTDFTAESGTLTFAANEMTKTVSVTTTDDSVDEDDETFTLTLSSPANATLGDATATGTINDNDVSTTPLTASFSNMPASHTGAEFTFGLAFSENVELSYVTLRDTAFVVTGGEVKTAQRQQQGSNQAWNITVEPTSANDTVTITLPETTDCNAVDAICTHDGRPLSHSLSATVLDAASSTAGDAANGDVVVDDGLDDALALANGVTPDEAAAALFGEGGLSEAQLDALDRLGNRNGRYDLGDMLSWKDRCQRGEARCGGTSTNPGPASSALLFGAAAARRRKTSGRAGRRSSKRRRVLGSARRVAVLVAAVTAGSCTDLVGPPGAEWDPGAPAVERPVPAAAPRGPGLLTVEWTAPDASRAAGVLLELEGPGIGAVQAASLEVYQSGAAGRHRIVVLGDVSAGPLLQFHVPERGRLAEYRVRVVQVTGEDYGLWDAGEYRALLTN